MDTTGGSGSIFERLHAVNWQMQEKRKIRECDYEAREHEVCTFAPSLKSRTPRALNALGLVQTHITGDAGSRCEMLYRLGNERLKARPNIEFQGDLRVTVAPSTMRGADAPNATAAGP